MKSYEIPRNFITQFPRLDIVVDILSLFPMNLPERI
jgi:hypothetical protein